MKTIGFCNYSFPFKITDWGENEWWGGTVDGRPIWALVDYWVFPPKSGSEPLGFYSVSIGSPLEMTLITWMTPWRSAVLRTYAAKWLSKLYTMMTVPQKNHQHIADWMAMYNRQNSHLKKPPPKLFALSPATSMILNRRQVLWSFVLVMVGLCQKLRSGCQK